MLWLWLISLAVAVVAAALSYRVAEARGRSGVLWGILGFLFPVVALVVVFLLPEGRKAI
jgi:hypothetical protein